MWRSRLPDKPLRSLLLLPNDARGANSQCPLACGRVRERLRDKSRARLRDCKIVRFATPPRQRQGERAVQPARRKLHLDRAVELLQALAQKSAAEAFTPPGNRLWAAALDLVEIGALVMPGPGEADRAMRRGERAILCGVGGQLVKHQRQQGGHLGGTFEIIALALMTVTAFGSLWFSAHPGISSMGKLLALSLACTLASAALFQPALMGPPRVQRK
jgi:hypothetical protein